MSKHTPAPWFVGLPGGPAGPFYSLVNSAGNVIAMQIPREEDVRLIRVTPELLAACKQFVKSMSEEDPCLEGMLMAEEMAIAAIAAAEPP